MELKIKKEVAQAILDYLVAQPFKEVFQLVNEIQVLKPVESEKQTSAKEEKKA